jgi:hypothetical protein
MTDMLSDPLLDPAELPVPDDAPLVDPAELTPLDSCLVFPTFAS